MFVNGLQNRSHIHLTALIEWETMKESSNESDKQNETISEKKDTKS